MRVRRCAFFVSVLTVLAAPAAAQSTTEDGIRAVLRGDYQAAELMLRPRAFDRSLHEQSASACLVEADTSVCGIKDSEEKLRDRVRQGDFVDWTLRAATVTRDGRTKRTAIDFEPSPSMQFLPLKYTELATGPTRSLARHFIEVFVWECVRNTTRTPLSDRAP